MSTTITDLRERNQQIVSGLKNGDKISDLAKLHNITKQRISQLAFDHGLRRRPRRDYSEINASAKRIRELSKRGKNIKDIATELNIEEQALRDAKNYLKKNHQISLRKYGPRTQTETKYNHIRELWKNGHSLSEIAASINKSTRATNSLINYLRSQYGWFPKRRDLSKLKPETEAKYQLAKTMLNEGKTVEEIAAEYKVDIHIMQSVVTKMCNNYGWKKK